MDESGIYIRQGGIFSNDALPPAFWIFYVVVPSQESLAGEPPGGLTDEEVGELEEVIGEQTTELLGPCFETVREAISFARSRAGVVVVQSPDGREFSAGAHPAQDGAMPVWRPSD